MLNAVVLVLTITLTRFSLIPVMGDIAVDMSQGLRICVRVFCLLYYPILLQLKDPIHTLSPGAVKQPSKCPVAQTLEAARALTF